MRIAVVGAGIVGVATAYELAEDGHEVSVFEQRHAVATESSFANGGVVAAGYPLPWAAPWMPLKLAAAMVSAHAPVRLGAGAFGMPSWISRYIWAARSASLQLNRRRVQRWAHYSQQRLQALTEKHGLKFEQTQGCLVALRSARQVARISRELPTLAELGIAHALVGPEQARLVEPAMAPTAPLFQALHLPGALAGNCRQFAQELKARAQSHGARFAFGSEVLQWKAGHPGQLLWRPSQRASAPVQVADADAVVVCTGAFNSPWLAKAGVSLPLQAVHGYSLTAPLRHRDGEPDSGPRAALVDARHGVSITRMGERVRVAGLAEIGGSASQLLDAPLSTLYKVLADWYPGSAELAKVQHWKGARPMLPDGRPVVGPAGPDGLWLNLGHGSSGWALCCGSARVIASQVGGRPAEVDVDGFGLERFR